MTKRKVTVDELVSKFNLKVIANEAAINNIVELVAISRLGLELTGIFVYEKIKTISYLGARESAYLNTLCKEDINKSLEGIFKLSPPAIILGKKFLHSKLILEIAKKYNNVPIIKTDYNFNEIWFTISTYMAHIMANYHLFHGTLIEIFGIGVILTGNPGIGKSEIALELVKRGHIFVGDDAIEIAQIGSVLWGRSSEITKGLIEVRGLGLLDFSKFFGYHKLVDYTQVQLVIELADAKDRTQYERLGKTNFKKILDLNIPYYKIPIATGRKVSDIIECVISDFILKKRGFNIVNEISKKIENQGSEKK